MSKVENKPYLFVGPTLHGVPAYLLKNLHFTLHPPVKRGDIEKLIHNEPPGKIILVDGTFQQYPSVGHAEILKALRKNWEVWGLSSMGAIRACEMQLYGMKGFGKVYERFLMDEDFSDDEVALIHGIDPPFLPITEPLIHIREFINHIIRAEYITLAQGDFIIHKLKSTWYGFRTLSSVRTILASLVDLDIQKNILKELCDFDKYRVKTLDFIEFIKSDISNHNPS